MNNLARPLADQLQNAAAALRALRSTATFRAARRFASRRLLCTFAICFLAIPSTSAVAQSSRYRTSDPTDPSASGFSPSQSPSGSDINLMPLPMQPNSPSYQSPNFSSPSYQQPPPSQLQQIPQSSPPQKTQVLHGIPSPATSFGKPSPPSGDGSMGDSPNTSDDNANAESENCPNCNDVDPEKQGVLKQSLFKHHAATEQPPADGTIPEQFQPGHYPRYLGFGEPLTGTSWQNRPWHVDFFTGSMIGDDAVDGVIGQEAGFWIGTRIGWDYDYYWGVETRFGYSWMSVFDRKHANHHLGTANIIDWDSSILYYPWGDSRWRPFLLVGLGISQFDSFGPSPASYNATLFEIPFGLGMKYRLNEWVVFRVDFIDNFAVGEGTLDNMNNLSFDAGIEYHFGGRRRDYWPWNPNPVH